MPIKSESSTPPPRIAKIGPYTVFVTPPDTPNATPKPNSPRKLEPVEDPKPVQPPTPPPVMAPPAQFYKEKPSSFAFIWDAVAKVQNAHASLDEQVAHWFGLNQSKYQWALDDYYETNGKDATKLRFHIRPATINLQFREFQQNILGGEVEISHAANLGLRRCGKSCIWVMN